MLLHEFTVRNYLIHQDTSLKLFPLTVFVGPNGGGKSALFDALLNFSNVSRGNIRTIFGPFPYSYRATMYHGAGNIARISYCAKLHASPDEKADFLYDIKYAQTGPGEERPSFTIFDETLRREPDGHILFDRATGENFPIANDLALENDRSIFAAIRQRQLSGQPFDADPSVVAIAQDISRFNKFRLDPFAISQPARTPELLGKDERPLPPPHLGYHGEGLAAHLYYLSEVQSPALKVIEDRLREVEPQFSEFEFNLVGSDRVGFSVVYNDRRQTVLAARLSSGILTFIGLIALVATTDPSAVLMIEEPENGLTPQAVRVFYEAVQAMIAGANGQAQVLISSHSPFVLCEAWNVNDVNADRDFIYQVKVVDGRSRVRRVSQIIQDHGIEKLLAKDENGRRTWMGLRNAEEIMAGYLS